MPCSYSNKEMEIEQSFRDFMQFVVVTSPHPPAPGEHTWNERIEVTYIYGQIVDWLSQLIGLAKGHLPGPASEG